jgi:hypothetical protein
LLVRVCVHLSMPVTDQDRGALEVSIIGCMMESSPPIGVHVVDVGLALNDGLERLTLE